MYVTAIVTEKRGLQVEMSYQSDMRFRPSRSICYLLAARDDSVLEIIQCQTTIHITAVVFPRNTEAHTLQALPLSSKCRSIHLEVLADMAWIQPRKSNDSPNGTTIRLPAPDANCTFGLRDTSYARIREGLEVEGLFRRAIVC